ncbi:MAG: hypothetical protein NTU44_13485 [Bacteroidetes bacterium]|nr:hypothetical protein [Bacteroidota bacterium]
MKTLPWVIITLLLLVILYLRECSPKAECPPPRVDTIPGDTIIQDTIIYKPHLVYRDTGSCQLLTQKIDTAAILAAYLAVNCYRDTLKNDTSALVVIENEVSMNELLRTRMEFLNRREKVIFPILPVSDKPKRRLYAGFIVGEKKGDCKIGPTIGFQTTKGNLLALSIDFRLQIGVLSYYILIFK